MLKLLMSANRSFLRESERRLRSSIANPQGVAQSPLQSANKMAIGKYHPQLLKERMNKSDLINKPLQIVMHI
jgi:hypothetical protein